MTHPSRCRRAGCCLTVVAIRKDGFEIDASEETLARTPHTDPSNVREILEADASARRLAQKVIETNPAVFGPARTPARV